MLDLLKWVSLTCSEKMKVTVVSRSGREVVKGGLELSDSVCFSLPWTFFFSVSCVIRPYLYFTEKITENESNQVLKFLLGWVQFSERFKFFLNSNDYRIQVFNY